MGKMMMVMMDRDWNNKQRTEFRNMNDNGGAKTDMVMKRYENIFKRKILLLWDVTVPMPRCSLHLQYTTLQCMYTAARPFLKHILNREMRPVPSISTVISHHNNKERKGMLRTGVHGVSKSFRTGRLEREQQMVQFSATRCSCIAIL
jgi:hypothetical protein